jgi:molybdopterin synthase catalytic subunit
MHVCITSTALDPWRELQNYQQQQRYLHGKVGATTIFIGTMRDMNEHDAVVQMELEHYPGMTESYLSQLAQQAISQWQLLDVLILHRVGLIKPNDPIVLVAVWSAHRAQAYEANRYLMEELKARAPLWKKETLTNQQTRWVEKNSPGHYDAD